ncbi:NUDIX domain-containing protein [uncultured Cohaesibacter sp.]|uniref:NUDIX hydrolase n=1 Tax=uncultured Cohaesibacter sp. TaxID=1002546 RepID=UPI0029C99C6B|nr:NUDIX domain-containing protein [uncultured Cohaesibacter sp.]
MLRRKAKPDRVTMVRHIENFEVHAELTANATRLYDGSLPKVRPKDAATLIILDFDHGIPKLLMGRRHMRHRFMPGKFVFPGGRLDASDRHVPLASDLHPGVMEKLRCEARNGSSDKRMRGLAVCAIRETYEEAGLFIGAHQTEQGQTGKLKGADWQAFRQRDLLPDLAPLRFIGRAITPPGRTRRFDTRFFAVSAKHIADRLKEGTGPSGELEDLHWLTIADAHDLDLPRITKEILHELEERLKRDPELSPECPTPFFFMRGKSMMRAEI